MKLIYRLLPLMLVIFTACDLRVQRVREFKPEGSGINYQINDLAGTKVKYMTGARWETCGKPSCLLSAWDEHDRTLWNALYAPERISSSVGKQVAVFPTRMSTQERIYILIQAVDTLGQNQLILAEYDSLGTRHCERVVMTSTTPVSGSMITDYDQNQVYVAGWFDDTSAIRTMYIFRFRPETRGTWTRKYQDPTLRFEDLQWTRIPGKDFIAAGVLDDAGNVYYIRFDSLGGFKKLVRHETPEKETEVIAVACDAEGNLGLTAVSEGAGTGADYLTLVYDENDSLRWAGRFDGPAHKDDIPTQLVMTGNAAAYVTGAGTAADDRTAIMTTQYAGDGTQQWTRNFTGRHGQEAYPIVMEYRFPVDHYVGQIGGSDLYIAGTSGNDALVVRYKSSGAAASLRFSRRGQTCTPVAVNSRYLTVNYEEGEKSGAYVVRFGQFEIPGLKRWD